MQWAYVGRPLRSVNELPIPGIRLPRACRAVRHGSNGWLGRGVSRWAGECSLQRCEELEHFGCFEDPVALFADVALDEYPGLDEAVDHHLAELAVGLRPLGRLLVV